MREELHYGYKKIIYEDGSIKYFDITVNTKSYRQITYFQAIQLESIVKSKLKHIRQTNRKYENRSH